MDGNVNTPDNIKLQHAMTSEFWINLNPDMSIKSNLDLDSQIQFQFSPEVINSALNCLKTDGYFSIDPVVPLEHCTKLGNVVKRVVMEGFPPPFVMVYDDFWKLLWRFDELLVPVLGANYSILPDFWVWHIDNDGQSSGWQPHRDNEWPQSETMSDDGKPLIITVWIPFTDATTQSSCIHVLPLSKDPNYPDNLCVNIVPEQAEQYVIPLSVTAGSILGWNQFIIHWGGQMKINAQSPRISLGIYYQSNEADKFDPFMLDRIDELTFEYRLGVISRMILKYKDLGIPSNLLRFCEMNNVILNTYP